MQFGKETYIIRTQKKENGYINMTTKDAPLISRRSHSIGKYDITLENELFKCRIYWAKVIGSETESLFTQYTQHTFYEIQYALEGCIVIQIEKNQQIRVEQSNFIVIPPDTFHQIVDGDSVGSRFIMAFSLEIKDGFLNAVPQELSELISHKETTFMRQLLKIIVSKHYHDDPLSQKQIAGYLECFMLEILEAACPFIGSTIHTESLNEKEMKVAQIKKFISHYNGIGIRPSDVSQKFNICERHLNRIFVEVTGETLKEAINRQKLAKIEELAATTSLSFREISELCGFSNAYAMNKFFKRYNYTGLTEYRLFGAEKKMDQKNALS